MHSSVKLIAALALSVALIAYGAWAYPPHRGMGYGSTSAPPTGALTGILLGNNTFVAPAADGTNVGAITIQGTNVAAATLSIVGTDAAKFRLSNTTVPSNLLVSGTQNAGTYSISIVATLPGATGSPFTQPKTITGSALTITSVSISCGSSCAFTPGQAGTIGTASATVSSGSLTGTFALKTSGTDNAGTTCGPATNLSITSGGVLSNNSSAAAGTYTVCLQYTQASAGNSPYSQAATVTGTSAAPGFHVATNGTNNGTCSQAQPCTLYAARAAMRNSSTKLTYVHGGSYGAPTDPEGFGCTAGNSYVICLNGSDNNETWQYWPSDGYCSAIFDGGSSSGSTGLDTGWAITGSGITLNGLQIQNIKDPHVHIYSNNNTIRNNCLYSQHSQILAPVTVNDGTGNSILHNDIRNGEGAGVNLEGQTSNTDVEWNFVDNTCTNALNNDCGALYTIQEGNPPDGLTGLVFSNNYVRNVAPGGNGVGGRCVYLDQASSQVTVNHNVCTGVFGEAWFNHGANNDNFNSNITDLWTANDQTILESQQSAAFLPMSGNTLQHHIIVTRNNGGGGNGYGNGGLANPTPTTINDNLYYNYGSGGNVNSTGSVDMVNGTGSDPNPTRSNPLFLTCPGGGVDSWSFKLNSTSPAFNSPVSFPAQGNNDRGIAWGMPGYWGPPGFTIPHTGSAPSYGPTC